MRKVGLFIAMACFAIHTFAKTPPNIILIIGDDISWDDLGAYGNPLIKTPNIDALARHGMKFTGVFLTSSSCSPSRTSILTGRYPHNTGAAELHAPLPEHLTYFPELLQKKGYYTALAGKWHEGPATKRAYDTLLIDPKQNGEGGEEQWVSLLQNRPKDKPFFFWLAPLDAHRPWSSETVGHRHNPDTEIAVPPTLVDDAETRRDLKAYYDEIARIDHYLGLLKKELESQQISDNTIIIFMADNGRAFPGSKTRLYDRGIKTPFLVSWPAGIRSGQTCESLISSIDIAPTLLQLAGAKPAAPIQGQSFAKLLTSPMQPFRNYIFSEHNWHDYEAYERGIRTKDFLYIVNKRPQLDNGGPIDANQSPSAKALQAFPRERLTKLQSDALLLPRPMEEFYVLKKDPLQQNNLAGKSAYAKQQEELKRVLANWQSQTNDTEPAQLTPDWYDRKTGEPLPAKGKRGEMPGQAKKAAFVDAKGPF